MEWLAPDEARIGLGCMRLSTEPERDEPRAIATVSAALDAGVTLFDTAHAYGLDDGDRGHNERMLATALRGRTARIVTKGGMARPDGTWRPDGRAGSIAADCEASLRALDGRPIDLYLLHAPDPRVAFATSVRALASLVERGLVARVGVCNVNRQQLKQALDLAPIAAIEVALGAGDDEALRGGVISLALERGLWVIAHAPLGGVKRAARLHKDKAIVAAATRLSCTPAQAVLAWLLALHPRVVAIPGARRPGTAISAAAASRIVLDGETRQILDERLGWLHPPRFDSARSDGEIVLLGGMSGAGKSTEVAHFIAHGYARLNRDERGGTLSGIARALDEQLASGARRVVLDNTYLTRATRHDILRIAARHRLPVRCVWLEIALADAQRNAVERMLDAHGDLLAPEVLARSTDDPTRLGPRVQYDQLRRLEPPEEDEGFASIERRPFVRRADPRREFAGRAVALEALVAKGPAILEGEPGPRLVFGWLPDGDAPLVEATRGLEVEIAACVHPGGPPICWCRPPLPGLLLAFAHRRKIDPARLTVVGVSLAHKQLAAAAGARFVEP
jgi:aryl-alcohol dehydrogenase-like predicted oxidoreductase/predicted kinase